MQFYPVKVILGCKGSQVWVEEVELNNGEIWRVEGECSRCGKCCERGICQSYDHEVLNGKRIAKCNAQWSKPWQCKIYPMNPYEDLTEGCTYKWRKIN